MFKNSCTYSFSSSSSITSWQLHKKKLIKDKSKVLKVLLDTGASGNLIAEQHVQRYHIQTDNQSEWKTVAGMFVTHGTVDLDFCLPEFSESKKLNKHLMFLIVRCHNMTSSLAKQQ